MRLSCISLLALTLLMGCSSMWTPQQTFSAPGPCGTLAAQRLHDTELAGLADGYEKAIFDKTYQDCLAARARYGE